MRLRPHHLLCTQGYEGKGYSDGFVENMDAITGRLRGNKEVAVEIVFSTDDICAKCPLMMGEDLCETNEKVKSMDRKIVDYFGISEKSYVYNHIVSRINSEMTPAIMNDICGGCEWYPTSACKENILGGV
ncbi:MAG: DUF1284 domain-containing protein [Defluviitaleaceae bacterium]|nr:DUF1284 domain-containing protein [Defluviitaleaceae bacterium]